MSKKKLDPADLKQCQTEELEGSFMTFGPRSYRRCKEPPMWVATEKCKGEDGRRGSMSMCQRHREKYEKFYQKDRPVTWKKVGKRKTEA